MKGQHSRTQWCSRRQRQKPETEKRHSGGLDGRAESDGRGVIGRPPPTRGGAAAWRQGAPDGTSAGGDGDERGGIMKPQEITGEGASEEED